MANSAQGWGWIPTIRLQTASVALGLALVLVLGAGATHSALGQTFTVLYNFTGPPDGGYPYAGLVRDAAGNLYGTTHQGGSSDYGTVFKVDTSGTEAVVHSFTGGADGGYPYAGLIQDKSESLYGTTWRGGSGYGVVFKLDTAGNETVLHTFTAGKDGISPYAGLITDATGNFYGTTEWGGSSIYGTVFKVTAAGKETVLYNFTGGSDGGHLLGGLVRDKKGNLYGTTESGGGYDDGTVYKLSSSGTLTVLHSFTGYPKDGSDAVVSLIMDAKGNLYGSTCWGGAYGWGTVFKVNQAGRKTVLHSFAGGEDGGCPHGSLITDDAGDLYGNTYYGGGTGCDGNYGCGTVFKLNTSGTESVLHRFAGGASDGAYPQGGLVRDAQGNLYGTATYSGEFGYGTVWKLTH